MSFFRREPHEHRRGHDPGLTVGRALGETMYHFRDNVSLQRQPQSSEGKHGLPFQIERSPTERGLK